MSVTYYLTNVCIDALYWPALWTLTLQAKQQRHERDLYELKIKAEREALETQLQMEENRQRVARVLLWHTQFIRSPTIYIYLSHILAFIFLCVWYLIQAQIEIQESLAGAQKETLEGLQEATTKMMSQQAEAARYTADTARHIKEVSNHSLPLCLENSLCLHFITKADWLLSFSKDITINAEEESIISSVKLIKSYI